MDRVTRSLALILAMLLGSVTGCGSDVEPGGAGSDGGGPSAARAPTSDVRLYLCQEILSTAWGGPPVGYRYLVLRPDTVVVWGLPAGGVEGEISGVRADRLGRWREEEGTRLSIHWPEEPAGKREWSLTAEDGGWRYSTSRHYERVHPIGADRLVGTLVADESVSYGIPGDTTTLVSSTRRLDIRADGRFARSHAAGATQGEGDGRLDEIGGATGSSSAGTWEVRGFTLILRPDDGPAERHTVFAWPGNDGSVGIDGRRFEKR